jgi:tight adherence protein C
MLEGQALLMIGIFVAVSVGAYALMLIYDPYRAHVSSRMEELQNQGLQASTTVRARSDATLDSDSRPTGLGSLLVAFRGGERARWQQRLTKAGIYHPAALPRLFFARLLLIVAPPLAAVVLSFYGLARMETALLIGCSVGGFGAIVPSFWLDRAITRYHLRLRRSLPDFLDLMIVCLEGGMSLQETIRRVSDELRIVHPSLAFELGLVQRDMELGSTVDMALKRFATRTDDEAIRALSTFIREAQRFGTNITEALRNHAEMLRSQREQAAEENAQKASVKILIPTLLLIFPAIFVVLVGPAVIQIQEAFGAK